MALIQRQDALRTVGLGEHDERCVGESDLLIALVADEVASLREIRGVKRRQLPRAATELVQHGQLGSAPAAMRHQPAGSRRR